MAKINYGQEKYVLSWRLVCGYIISPINLASHKFGLDHYVYVRGRGYYWRKRKAMTENKLTIADLARHIGKKAVWTSENGMKFEVEILNVEIFYGSAHFTIRPVAGEGQARVRDALEIKNIVPMHECN